MARGLGWGIHGYIPIREDWQIQEMYEDWVQSNNGAHLSWWVADDKV